MELRSGAATAGEVVRVRELTFRTEQAGPADGAPVLLLHGFPQHSGEWAAVLPVLHAAGLRTITVDQRGYSPGARPADVEAYRIVECALDAASIVDELGYDSVHVVGHDWGAICAWHLAGRHPERVRTLTAISAPHPCASAQAFAEDSDGQRERSSYVSLFRQAGHAETVLLADGARWLRQTFDGAGLPAETIDGYVAPLREPGALTAALNWYRAISRADLAGLGAIGHPTAYLWGDADAATGRAAAELCGEYVAGDFRFVPLPGIGHWVPDQAPADVAAAVIARIRD
jgi:pimeloyl-ACP methyl ester carboxylesterase